MTGKMLWPEVFTNPGYNYSQFKKHDQKACACADGLEGWGNCISGLADMPPNGQFGWALIKISKVLGISATKENLMAYADKLKPSPITQGDLEVIRAVKEVE